MSDRARGSVRWILWLMLVCAGTLVAGWIVLTLLRPRVYVTTVTTGPVVQAFYSTGTISPEREFPIKSAVSGTIIAMPVDKGTRVTKDMVLATIADPERDLMVKRAIAELEEKQQLSSEQTSPVLREFDAKIDAQSALLDIAKREQDRVQNLLEKSAGSQTDLDQAMDRVKRNWSELEALKAQRETKKLEQAKELDVAKAVLGIAEWNAGQQTLRSPIDGVVLDRPVSLGTRLAINDHVMQVADVSAEHLVMRAAVDEEDINKVRAGQLVRMTLYAFPGEVIDGAVSRIYDKADADRRTFEVDIKLEKVDARLAAGMTGELAFIMASKDKANVVPSQAVQSGSVYVVRDGEIVKASVEIGLKNIERAEVISGLSPGDKVLISSIAGLREGQSVRVKELDPYTAAGLNKPVDTGGAFKAFE